MLQLLDLDTDSRQVSVENIKIEMGALLHIVGAAQLCRLAEKILGILSKMLAIKDFRLKFNLRQNLCFSNQLWNLRAILEPSLPVFVLHSFALCS